MNCDPISAGVLHCLRCLPLCALCCSSQHSEYRTYPKPTNATINQYNGNSCGNISGSSRTLLVILWLKSILIWSRLAVHSHVHSPITSYIPTCQYHMPHQSIYCSALFGGTQLLVPSISVQIEELISVAMFIFTSISVPVSGRDWDVVLSRFPYLLTACQAPLRLWPFVCSGSFCFQFSKQIASYKGKGGARRHVGYGVALCSCLARLCPVPCPLTSPSEVFTSAPVASDPWPQHASVLTMIARPVRNIHQRLIMVGGWWSRMRYWLLICCLRYNCNVWGNC